MKNCVRNEVTANSSLSTVNDVSLISVQSLLRNSFYSNDRMNIFFQLCTAACHTNRLPLTTMDLQCFFYLKRENKSHNIVLGVWLVRGHWSHVNKKMEGRIGSWGVEMREKKYLMDLRTALY